MVDFRKIALTPDVIGRAIASAIEQPADVDVNEIIVRPTAGNQWYPTRHVEAGVPRGHD